MCIFRTWNGRDHFPAGNDMIHVEKALASGRQALEEGRLDEAEAELRTVLEFDDFEPRALRLMGKVASRRGDPRRAAEFLQKALKARDPAQQERPKGPVPTPTLAELYASQGHSEAAADVYRQLVRGAGDDERTAEWRRRLAALEGEGEAEAASHGGDRGGEAEPATAELGAGAPGEEVDPEVAERRLRAFLELLDGNREAGRLRRFLDRLEDRPSQ